MGVVDQSRENKMGPKGHICAHVCAGARIQIKKNDWRLEGRTGGETHLEFRSTDHKPLSENPHDSDPFFLETAAQKLSEIQLAQRSAFKRSETDVCSDRSIFIGKSACVRFF